MLSTSESGPPDLDLRPAPMRRYSMQTWVVRCPGCGYCARSIEQAPEGVRAVVDSETYRAQLEATDAPELANSFLCQALLDEAQGRTVSAVWAAVRAAWVCDDAELEDAATTCRRRARALLAAMRRAGHTLRREPEVVLVAKLDLTAPDDEPPVIEERVQSGPGCDPAIDLLIEIDLTRRCGDFDEALRLAGSAHEGGLSKAAARILRLQKTLAEAGDRAAHTFAEV